MVQATKLYRNTHAMILTKTIVSNLLIRMLYFFLRSVKVAPVVMVVDDDYNMRANTSMFLKKQGCTVLEASNGLNALEVMRSNLPDIVLSDVLMPEMGGLELYHRINNMHPKLPFIPMTAHIGDSQVIKLEADAACTVLEKPILGQLWPHILQKLLKPPVFFGWVLPSSWRRLISRIHVVHIVLSIMCIIFFAFSLYAYLVWLVNRIKIIDPFFAFMGIYISIGFFIEILLCIRYWKQ